MKLIRVGFFRELRHGDRAGPSLHSLRNENPQKNQDFILRYLRMGHPLVVCPGIVDDALNPKNRRIAAPHIMTDGKWAWPNDLPYYVEKYNISLPTEFVAAMQDNLWKVRTISEQALTVLEL